MNKLLSIFTISIIVLLLISSSLSIGINIEKTMEKIQEKWEEPKELWNKTYGGTALDWGWCVQETIDGGIIIAGETVSYGSGGYDAWLIKTDSYGNESWNKTYGGSVKDGGRFVKQTSDGGYIIGGYVDSYGNPGHDVWLIKTDDDGVEQWNSIFGGLASDAAFSVIQTSDGGYAALGYVDSYGAGNHDIWLIKTNSYGIEQWNKTFGTIEWELGYSVLQTSDEGYIIIGTTMSYGSGGQDAWLIKTDIYGNEMWNKTYGGIDNDWGSAVVITDDGGYLITGDTRSFGSGGYDLWMVKTDNYGNEQWKRVYGNSSSDDTGYSMKKTIDGGYIILATKTSFSSGLSDIWLIKTNIDGYIEWNLTIDGGKDDWGYSVDKTSDGGYIITGLTNSYGSGDYDLWLIKVVLENHENQPPTIPKINGTTNGKVGEEYTFTFNSEDPEDDDVYYYIKWGDEHVEVWDGPHHSGVDAEVIHTYAKEATYVIKARTKDIYGAVSDWSEFTVSMPRCKTIFISVLFRLLKQYLILYKLFYLIK